MKSVSEHCSSDMAPEPGGGHRPGLVWSQGGGVSSTRHTVYADIISSTHETGDGFCVGISGT